MAEEKEEKEEDQPTDSRSVVEAAYDEAVEEEEAEVTAAEETKKAAPEAEAAPDDAKEEKEEQSTDQVEEAAQEEVKEEPEPIDAPAYYSLEDQEMFRALDPKGQAFLLDRYNKMEAAHTQRSQEIAPLRKATEKWTPYLAQIQAEPSQVFDSLMQHEYGLRTGTNEQKMNILMGLARDYGVNFTQEANGAPSAEEDPFGIHQQIQQAVTPITNQLQQLTGNIEQNNYATQQSSVADAQKIIDNFKDEKGADGKPAHPHFDEIGDDMLALAQAKSSTGQPLDIAELYDSACWANPSVRAKMTAAENFKSQQDQRKADKERARKAKTAAGSLAGGGGGGKEQPANLRAVIEEAYDSAT